MSLIVIDPGHGGTDPGAVGARGQTEKDIVLIYAQDLRATLMRQGHNVRMTRRNDTFVPLSSRAQIANEFGADAFISLHANAAESKMANGAWVIYDDMTKPEKGKQLATNIFNYLKLIPGVPDLDPEIEVYSDKSPWVGYRDLAVLSQTRMPAVLVELGFMTNEEDLSQLQQAGVRTQIINAIANGLNQWLKWPMPVAPTPQPVVLTLEERVGRIEAYLRQAGASL